MGRGNAGGLTSFAGGQVFLDFLEKQVDVAGPVIAGKGFDLLIVILCGDVILAMLGVEAVTAKMHGKGIEVAAGGGAELFGGLGGGCCMGIHRGAGSRGGFVGRRRNRSNVRGRRGLGLRSGRVIWGRVIRCH